ncbi:MAG: TetR/AcrR family transcriptional regulator [Pseudonocardia sp.]|nr:TetR/AcrR family transcriptional regulator [Pseudonocardia sp.]
MSGSAPRAGRKAAPRRGTGGTGGTGGGAAPVRASSTARRELVENEIYEHATRLFAERGFAGTSLQDIADALGITRPALYYYVKSKDELLAKLVTEVTDGPLEDVNALLARPGLDPAAQLRGIVEIIVARHTRQPDRFRLLIRSEAELPAELTAAYDASRRAVLKAVAGVVDDGVRAGLFRPVDPRVAALGVLGMCNWVAWWYHDGGPAGADTVVGQFADMAVGALQRPDHQALDGGGPAAALKQLRQDLDHLERVLDL